jgi:L-threonylcarbamoyladenylate synthase
LRKRQTHSKRIANRIFVDPQRPDASDIRRAVDVIHRGGVVVIPTAGLYGLGADALNEDAVQRVFAIKRRPADNPVLVLLSALADMDRLVRSVPDYARPLLSLWPGGITFVFEAAEHVSAALTAGTGRIGVRLPAHPVVRALVARVGGPITGTSANISGMPAAARASDLDPALCDAADLVLDAGELAGGPGSTIVDVSVWPVKIIREGAVAVEKIYALVKGQ